MILKWFPEIGITTSFLTLLYPNFVTEEHHMDQNHHRPRILPVMNQIMISRGLEAMMQSDGFPVTHVGPEDEKIVLNDELITCTLE